MKTKISILGLILIGISSLTSAATIYVDAAATGANNGTSWIDAYTTIQAAVAASAADDTIRVASGEYLLSAEIAVDKAVTILAENGSATTLVNGGGTTRCFNMTAAGVIDGFTITNGVTTTGGGGVKMTAGTVRNCVIIKNTAGTTAAAGGGGGGVWMSGGLVHDCDIIGNTGRVGNDDGGGGARLSGGTISNCYVYANLNVGAGCGGGIALMNNAALAIDCTVVGNSGYYAGGGIWAYPGRAHRCVMTANRVTNNSNGGGGAGLRDGGILDSCIVTNNTGHGVYYRNGTVRNSLVARNSSAGIIPSVSGGQINNCTLADNVGVGVQLDASGTTIRNTILHGNSAVYGGGNLASTLWYNNCTPTAIPGGSVLSDNVVGDPLFVSSSTGNYRLQAASPCIDAGLNLASLGVVADMAGTPRPTRNGYDIGCYEEAQAAGVMNLAAVVTSAEAALGGKLLYDGQLPTTAILYWGMADGGTDAGAWQHAVVLGTKATGDIYTTTVGVSSATTYYFRNAASNDYDLVWANDSQRFVSFSGTATDRVWNGAGADSLASNGDNWEGGVAPQPGDGVVLDIASSKNMTWDAAAPSELSRWTQGAGYTGAVTIETLYGDTGFTNLTIAGDCLLLGGTWTHKGNTTAELYRLRVTVGGDMTLDGGAINVTGKGYRNQTGPGGAVAENQGAAHGGIAYYEETHGEPNFKTYGSIDAPIHLGSGGGDGGSYGGGAVFLTVAGHATIGLQSTIVSRGNDVSRGSGSGGSILLETGTLGGSGTISVNGGGTRYGGGGGRAAVVLSGSGADFSGWTGTVSAYGLGRSGAGTVYLRAADGHDALIVDNNNLNTWAGGTTLMTTDPAVDLNSFDEVVVRNRGILGVASTTALDMSLPNVTLAGAGYSVIDIMADDSLVYPANWVVSNVTIYAEGIAKPLVNLTIDATGSLSHRPNLKLDQYRVDLDIAGNLVVRNGGSISTMGHGFFSYSGPGYSVNEEQGGAHGGVGGWNNNNAGTKPANIRTYGSILNPTLLGSGGQYSGGGAILLNVGGTTTVESGALVTAQGIQAGNRAGGSGGSVNLRTGSLVGAGAINAKGGGNYCGAGGRVAVTLTAGDFSGWTGNISAYGYGTQGGAGTVYLADSETPPGAGQVVVDNNNQTPWSAAIHTPMPAFAASTEDLKHTQWLVRNKGSLKLVADTMAQSFEMQSLSYLDLAGFTLVVDAMTIAGDNIPAGEYAATSPELGTGFVSDSVGGGTVVVRGRATLLILR